MMKYAHAHAQDAVIAVVNNEKIYASELKKLIIQYKEKSRKTDVTPEEVKGLAESLVIRAVILQQPDVKALKTNAEIRRKVKKFEDELIITTFVNEYVNTRSVVTEKDLRNYYNAHINQIKEDKIPTVSVILLRTREEAEQIYAKINQGEEFSKLAAEFSLDLASAEKGGSLGQVRKTTVPSEIWDVVVKLETGQISEIIKARYGYTIVKVDNISSEKVYPYDTIKEQIRKSVVAKQNAQIKNTMVADLKKAAAIEIYDERVLETFNPMTK
nr:peptidylprolyl isomerase [uncultured Desulfobacter sp.]